MSQNIVTIIGFVFTLIGNYFIYLKRAKEDSIDRAKSEQKQNDRLDRLETKIDEHNGYAKLFRETSADISDIKADNRVMKNELQNLKEEIRNVQKYRNS